MAQFFFGGGHPGFHHERMGGGRGRGSSGPVDNSKFYTALGVEKTATKSQIRKAYLKKAQKEHPDKGGDEEKFKMTQKAYDVLHDEEKREIYDQYGEEGLENGGGGGHEDMMSAFFGGGQRQRGPQKGEDSETELKVSLEDLYKGKTTKIALNKTIYKVDPRGRVQDSRGRTLSKTAERKKIDVEIDRGMMEGQRITISGEGDVIPGILPGDLILIVKEKNHPTFKRKGSDLIMQKSVSLTEALTGLTFTIETLDKRTLYVTTPPGTVIKPNTIMQIKDEGMPMYRHPEQLGCLLIQFKVEFPTDLNLSPAQIKALQGIIGGAMSNPQLGADMEEVELSPLDEEGVKNRERTRKHFSGENSEDRGQGGVHMGGQNVQCAQS